MAEAVTNWPIDRVFPDPRQRDAMLVDLLEGLLRRGAMDLDGIKRAVLPVADAAAAVPPGQQHALSLAMTEALVCYLDGDWGVSVMGEALEAWRTSVAAARGALRWTDLPPVTRRVAELYARTLLAYAERRGYVGRLELSDHVMWKLSDAGGDALPRLRHALTGGDTA